MPRGHKFETSEEITAFNFKIFMEKPFSIKAWFLAARPKTLSASLTPVIVGNALAWRLNGSISWGVAALTALMAVLIQVGINLINDALDFKKGADNDGRIGFPRATQQGWLTFRQVFVGGWLAFGAAFLCSLFLAHYAGGVVILIATLCIIGGYLYTGGPYPIAYLGLSDPCVLFFFGIVATGTSAYVQLHVWPFSSFVAGLQLGLLATAISAINNLRDIEQDRLAGKRTLPVRCGISWGRIEIVIVAFLPFALGLYWLWQGILWAGLLPLGALPLALRYTYGVFTSPPSRAYNGYLAQAAMSLLAFGVLLSVGLFHEIS